MYDDLHDDIFFSIIKDDIEEFLDLDIDFDDHEIIDFILYCCVDLNNKTILSFMKDNFSVDDEITNIRNEINKDLIYEVEF